ncbi:MAG: P-loop NTPase fold protein [Oscillospiraceae bacterium]
MPEGYTENDNFFIKDNALKEKKEDFFDYTDYSDVLRRLLSSQDPPFNVALVGKWGLGKSSLINLVREDFKQNIKDGEYKFITINAWKYEKEALRNIFLIKSYEGLTGRKAEIDKNKFFSKIYSYNVKLTKKDDGKTGWKKFISDFCSVFVPLLWALLKAAVAALLLFIAFKATQFTGLFPPEKFNDLFVFFVTFGITTLSTIAQDVVKAIANKPFDGVQIKVPITSTEEYEHKLDAQLKQRPKLKKFICIIDDLDRLNTPKMVEALDAIKGFVDFPKCIFIVPFDEEIIKTALSKSKKCNPSDGYDMVESDLILDKLFQFRLYLPPILNKDRVPYALEICNQVSGLTELCNVNTPSFFKNNIIQILIHYYVTTPRQIKKIINTFSTNIQLINARCGGILKVELTDDVIKEIAKLAVLQADYNEFYIELFEHPSLLKNIININKDYCELSEIKEGEQLLSKDEIAIYLKLKGTKTIKIKELIHFLNAKEYIEFKNLLPLLYLSSSRHYSDLGNGAQSFFELLASADEDCIRYLNEFENPIEIIIKELQNGEENYIVRQYLLGLLKIYKDIDGIKQELANTISQSIISSGLHNQDERKGVKIVNIINIILDATDNEGLEKLLQEKIHDINVDVDSDDDEFELYKEISPIIEKFKCISSATLKIFKEEALNDFVDSEEVEDLTLLNLFESLEFETTEEICSEFIDVKVLEKLVILLINEQSCSKKVWNLFIHTISIYRKQKRRNELIIIISPLLRIFYFVDKLFDFITEFVAEKDNQDEQEIISDESKKQIMQCFLQIEITKENSNRILNFANKIQFEMIDSLSKEINTFLCALFKFEHLDQIMNAIAQQDKFELLDNVIVNFNKELFTDNANIKLFKETLNNYSEAQLSDLMDNIDTYTNYSTDDFEAIDKAYEIIEILIPYEEAQISLSRLLNILEDYFYSHSSNYTDWSSSIVKILGVAFSFIEQSQRQRYIEELNDIFTNETYINLSIKAYRYIKESISESEKKIIVTNLLSDEPQHDLNEDYFCALKNMEIEIKKDKTNIKKYEQKLLSIVLIETMSSDVLNTFDELGQLEESTSVELFKLLNQLTEVFQNQIVQILNNQIQYYEDPCTFIDLLLNQSDYNGDLLNSIIILKSVNNGRRYLNKISLKTNLRDNSSEYLLRLLQLQSLHFEYFKNQREATFLIIEALLLKNQKRVDIIEFCNILNSFTGIVFSIDHKKKLKSCISNIERQCETLNEKEAVNNIKNILKLNSKSKKVFKEGSIL